MAYFKAYQYILSKRKWVDVVLPGLLLSVFLVIGFYLFTTSASTILHISFLEKIGLKQWLDRQDSAFITFIFSFNGLVIWMVGTLFYLSVFKSIWLLVTGMYFQKLAQKVNLPVQVLLDNPSGTKIFFLEKAYSPALLVLNSMLWQSVYYMALFIIAFIPLIGWVTPLVALVMEAYYLGMNMLGFAFRKGGLSNSAIRGISGDKRGLAIGNGLVFYMLLIVPVAGWLLAPALGIVAANYTVSDAEKI